MFHSKELQFALDLARRTGEVIRANFALGMKKEWKKDETPVTKTDFEVNRLLINAVKERFPDHGVFGEEESLGNAGREYVWVCDPVDGTIPFSHGIPTCMFLLALTRNGESLLGVAYDPFMDRMFFAEKGKGAFLNGERIFVSKQKEMKNALVGIVHWSGARYDLRPVFSELDDRWAFLISLCSTGYMASLVACGEFVANIFQGIEGHAVDAAAHKVIIEEAGGKVTDLFGEEQRYDGDIRGFLMSNGLVHDELVKLIKRHVVV